MSGLSIKIEIDASLIRQLEDIPRMMKFAVADKCFAAFAKPIVERAKALAPSSRTTGTRGEAGSKWGRKATKKFSGRASMLQYDSGKFIGSKVFKGATSTVLYVGATHPRGNKQQFDASKDGRQVYYWGRRQGSVKKQDRPNFLERAYTETQSAAYAAFRAQLAKQIKELRLG
jgi:hypothetical protein